MARAKRLILTLDVMDFCDAAASLINDQERAEFLFGFQCGIRGLEGRDDLSDPFISGYSIGIEMAAKRMQKCRNMASNARLGYAAMQESRSRQMVRQMVPISSPNGAPNGADAVGAFGDVNGRQMVRQMVPISSPNGVMPVKGTDVTNIKEATQEDIYAWAERELGGIGA